MDTLGSEVGHKMRAAIKAKLNELGCYVDDELPDYVMVMVANKRSRLQMEDDLQLFLGPKTEMFVYWLHQVLQKLQEVKIPPIGPSMDELKRQSSTDSEVAVKKERKEKRHKKSKKDDKHKKSEKRPSLSLSLDSEDSSNLKITDLLANQLLETVKKSNTLEEIVKTESKPEKVIQKPVEKDNHNTDEFDIPTISEIEKESSKLTEKLSGITEIDKKIENARQELEVMKSDSDDDVININNDGEELSDMDESKSVNEFQIEDEKIIEPSLTPPRKPMSERLGQKCAKPTTHNRIKTIEPEKSRKPLNRNTETKITRNSIHSRLGSRTNFDNRISSKIIAVSHADREEKNTQVSLPSIVKVKARPQLPASIRPNSNLLLKAMAEAQKSVEQITRPQVVQRKPIELYTKKNRKRVNYARSRKDMRITVNADDLDSSFEENSMEYTPEPILNVSTDSNSGFQEYIPSLISKNEMLEIEKDEDDKIELTPSPEQSPIVIPQFVVTLDGLDTSQFPSRKRKLEALKTPKNTNVFNKIPESPPKKKIEKRKHTPIVFDKVDDAEKTPKSDIRMDSESELTDGVTDNVKVIINDADLKIGAGEKTVKLKETQSKYDHIPAVLSEVTKKERCKFYPSCRLGDTCEFLHPAPTVPCKAFPVCKFGNSCLYLHPRCKFGQDCIRKRECPYSHGNGVGLTPTPAVMPTLSSTVSVVPNTVASGGFKTNGVTGTMCRFYPQCSNPQCMFYHPKLCRFGKYCHNKAECNFYHPEVPSKEKFVWKPAASTAT